MCIHRVYPSIVQSAHIDIIKDRGRGRLYCQTIPRLSIYLVYSLDSRVIHSFIHRSLLYSPPHSSLCPHNWNVIQRSLSRPHATTAIPTTERSLFIIGIRPTIPQFIAIIFAHTINKYIVDLPAELIPVVVVRVSATTETIINLSVCLPLYLFIEPTSNIVSWNSTSTANNLIQHDNHLIPIPSTLRTI